MRTRGVRDAGIIRLRSRPRRYFSDVLTCSNVPLSLVPTPLTAATITMAMPIAIKAYSIVVAPDRSPRKLDNNAAILKLR